MGMKCDGNPSVVEQNSYATKIVNSYIVYELWPKVFFSNFKLQNCLFGATNIVKNSGKAERGLFWIQNSI